MVGGSESAKRTNFPGAGPTVVSPPGDEGTHGKRDKGLTPPLKDRDIYMVARLNASNEARHAEVARHGFNVSKFFVRGIYQTSIP